jgi:hypothetical protein
MRRTPFLSGCISVVCLVSALAAPAFSQQTVSMANATSERYNVSIDLSGEYGYREHCGRLLHAGEIEKCGWNQADSIRLAAWPEDRKGATCTNSPGNKGGAFKVVAAGTSCRIERR